MGVHTPTYLDKGAAGTKAWLLADSKARANRKTRLVVVMVMV